MIDSKILFEVITPPIRWNKKRKLDFIQTICNIAYQNDIKFINIPQIVDESRDGERVFKFLPKEPNHIFAKQIVEYSKSSYNFALEPIINIVVPIINKANFLSHFNDIYQMGYKNYIFVGKDRSDIEYPGYEVTQAVEIVKNKYSDVKIGGIVIFHRENEIKRMIKKINSGVDFFVSQIVYDIQDFRNFIKQIQEISINTQIYVSVAPLITSKEIEFAKWLGVNLSNVNFNPQTIKEDSMRIIKNIINEVAYTEYAFARGNIQVRWGINIEHITYSNLSLSEEVIKMAKLRLENVKYLLPPPVRRNINQTGLKN
ncbi:MAG: methylenetetrahydrofolate reductase [bacterium]